MELSEKVVVCVLEGFTSKYIKIIRRRLDHVAWINLTESTFYKLLSFRHELMAGKTLEYPDCVVRTHMYEGKLYVSFMKEKGVFKSRLNLNEDEWQNLLNLEEEIKEKLKAKEETKVKVLGMTTRYLVRDKDKNFYFFDEEDASEFGLYVLKQEHCITITTLLPNPQEEEIAAQYWAYAIDLHMKSQCEGCDRDYPSQKDHPCLMDWEERLNRDFDKEFMATEMKPICRIRLNKVFGISISDQCQPEKARVRHILEEGQSPEYVALMRRVLSLEEYRSVKPISDDLDNPLVINIV